MDEFNMEMEQQRLIDEAVEDARRRWEAGMAERLAEARAEGERIAGMTAEERLAERERKLAAKEREMLKKELYARMELKLIEDGLPRELAKAFDYENEERAMTSYAAITRVFRDCVQEKVAERLGSIELPKIGGVKDTGDMTDEQYYAMRMGI